MVLTCERRLFDDHRLKCQKYFVGKSASRWAELRVVPVPNHTIKRVVLLVKVAYLPTIQTSEYIPCSTWHVIQCHENQDIARKRGLLSASVTKAWYLFLVWQQTARMFYDLSDLPFGLCRADKRNSTLIVEATLKAWFMWFIRSASAF